MLRFEEARERLLSLARPLGQERVGLDDAMDRVLADDVVAAADFPAADTSAMDGYAVTAADVVGAITLKLAAEARPGGPPVTHERGTATRIFTGAALPRGADAVVPQENVVAEAGDVSFPSAVAAFAHVRRRGEDLASGTLALSRGTRLAAAQIGLLASLDRAWVNVARRPRVTVFATGDELRLPGASGPMGSIAESGTFMVRAMARRCGANVVALPSAPDDLAAIARTLGEALASSDVVITIGGMSVGDHDLVRPALRTLGVELDLWKVAIKPGKPLGIASANGALMLGLPGNPAAAFVTFGLFGVPLLRRLQGAAEVVPAAWRATLTRPIAHKPGRLEFVRATLRREAGELVATPLAHQSSGSVASVGQADALVVVPQDAGALSAGERVDVVLFSDLS